MGTLVFLLLTHCILVRNFPIEAFPFHKEPGNLLFVGFISWSEEGERTLNHWKVIDVDRELARLKISVDVVFSSFVC